MNRFSVSCRCFGLTVSLGKTEAIFQPPPSPQNPAALPTRQVTIDDTEIKTVEKFCYLGSTISSNGPLDDEISLRTSKASSSFGRLTKRLWQNHGMRLHQKTAVYRAVVLSALVYDGETWATYRRHIHQQERFHQRCLQSICNIKWQAKVSNLEVLQKCGLPSVESLIMKTQLQWAGQVVQMPDGRIPKLLLYRQLKERERGKTPSSL